MTSGEITESIKTGELQLSGSHKRTHYEPAFWIAFVGLISAGFWIYDFVIRPENRVFHFDDWSFYIPAVFGPQLLGGVTYILQKRRLRLTKIGTCLSHDDLQGILDRLAGREGWRTISRQKRIYVAATDPSFWSGSWGERITVIFDESCVYVNSICDPDKRPSLVSFGRNRHNVRLITNRIHKADPFPDFKTTAFPLDKKAVGKRTM